MAHVPQISKAALAAGIPARYCYWFGRSGQRYLFTAAGWASACDFCDCVAISVRNGQVLWAGEIASLEPLPSSCGAELYVHLLATSAEERRCVIDDISPDPGHLKLAA